MYFQLFIVFVYAYVNPHDTLGYSGYVVWNIDHVGGIIAGEIIFVAVKYEMVRQKLPKLYVVQMKNQR